LQKIVSETVLEHNVKLVGTTQKILLDEQKAGKYFGRTDGFKVVEISQKVYSSSEVEKLSTRSSDKTDQPLTIGQFTNVKIESASSWKLCGKF
jgi:tRNA A37 methylthiotransferase MiaB